MSFYPVRVMYTPLSYSKTVDYRAMSIFLIFYPIQRLWVFVTENGIGEALIITCTNNQCLEHTYIKKT